MKNIFGQIKRSDEIANCGIILCGTASSLLSLHLEILLNQNNII